MSSNILAANTPVSLYRSFEGNIAATIIGNSELTETNGSANCGNGSATSANLTLPNGAAVRAAYLYWYAMTENTTDIDNYPFIALSNTSSVTFPGFTGVVTSTRSAYAEKAFNGGIFQYGGRFVDVTNQISTSPNGNYTVDVQGGASNFACPLTEENARAWSLIVIYDAPSLTENKKIYVYDGLKMFLNENISIPVTGFEIPATLTAGSLTVVSLQGDVNLPGEFMNTSDTSFPNFPVDFANSDPSAAYDIDTVMGDFTAGSTTMDLNAGTVGDLILTGNIVLTVPTVPTHGDEQCFAMTDNIARLYKFDLDINTAVTVVNTTKILNGEGAAYRATDDSLYTFHQDAGQNENDPADLYRVEMDGTVTLIKRAFVPQKANGAEFVSYSDGTERFLTLQHEDHSKISVFDATDLVSATPLKTISLTFPNGSDARVASLAVNPLTGEVLVTDDDDWLDATDYSEIYSVNMQTGQLTLKTVLSTVGIDAESLAFSEDGELYTENEAASSVASANHKLFRIDLATGDLTAVENIPTVTIPNDIEGMSCIGSKILTPPLSSCNFISGEFNGTFGTLPTGTTRDLLDTSNLANYTYDPVTNSLAGRYAVLTDATTWHTLGFWSTLAGHTTGDADDAYLAINGSVNEGVFYTQQFNGLTQGDEYKIGVWVANATLTGHWPVDVGLRVIDSSDAIVHTASLGPMNSKHVWKKLSSVFTVPNTGNYRLEFYSISTGHDGNDFALDDISFEPATNTCSSLTVVHHVVNDNGGTKGGSDFAITSNAGGFVEDSALVSGDTTTYTSKTILVIPRTITITAPNVTGYSRVPDSWSCTATHGSNPVPTQSTDASGLTGSLAMADGDNITCVMTYNDDVASCDALSGSVNVAISPISILKAESLNNTESNDDFYNKLFVATTDHLNNTGNVTAYAIGSDELPVSSSSWDAASVMANRRTRLFTTNANGLVTFGSASLTNTSFDSNGSPSSQTIKTNVGNAVMGRISPNSRITLLEDTASPLRYLNEPDYRDFYRTTVSKRSSVDGASVPTQVLVTSDDGFLYSFNQSNGNLNWGWMPPSLALELKYAAGFADHHYMQGEIDQLDLKSGTAGSYAFGSYIVGSYRGGLGQYVLKLGANSSLASVISNTDHTVNNALVDTAPNQGKRAYFSDVHGIQYMAYIITASGTDSVLYLTKMMDGTHTQVTLGFTATSTPFVMPDLLGSSSPAKNKIYLGSHDGNIYAADLFENDNVTINSSLSSVLYTSPTPVATLHPSGQSSSEILYIGASVAIGGQYHLHAQAEDRMTLFNYETSSTTWSPNWTTSTATTSTATSLTGKWTDVNGTLTFGANASITPLPTGARITDEAYIIANSIVLPVTEVSTTANACYGDAYYYFYQLSTGDMPIKTFFTTSSHAAITAGKVRIGKGEAMSMHLTTSPNDSKLVALGLADQNVNGGTGVSESFYVKDPVTSGIRSWKELH